MKIRQVQFSPALLPLLHKGRYVRRVAAYARVSTDSAEQGASLEAQRDYYEQYIKARGNWSLVDIYYDSGISGLSHKKRDGFNRMIADALDGKIDLIVTKSLSRFARNTVDTLTTIRKLKAAGVEVFFEKENIYTLDSKGEFLITLMSSMAQEESRSISENITWGQRKRFADGRYSVPYSHFLGYDKGDTNELIVNPEQAKIVRMIFRLYLEGKTERTISFYLKDRNIPSPSGKQAWSKTTVNSILTNEKYKGDALLQKSFTVDFLSKKVKKNEGELPRYYVEKGHTPIVSDEVFAMTQEERAKRLSWDNRYSSKHALSSKIICGCCGGLYGTKTAHSNDKYRKEFWRCNAFYDGELHAPRIDDKVVRRCCQAALLHLIAQHTDVIAFCASALGTLSDFEPEEWERRIFDVLQRSFAERFHDEMTWRSVFDRIVITPQYRIRIHYMEDSTDYFEAPFSPAKVRRR